ncbi:MAG: hypothetical protein J5878_04310 [Oscillospiraceae bacterium]|nr:hypothetical protein [Oscillospiraceae bacterium]
MAENKTTKAEAAPKKVTQSAKKAEPAVKKAAQTIKKPQTIAVTSPTGGSTVGLRIGAVALWLLALICEAFAVMALLEYFFPPFGMSPMAFLIGMIVLDLAFTILAAQLWKKANHIKPMSEKRGKLLFYLWNELGVIMACICFLPLIVLLLKNDKLDKKTKAIATVCAMIALLISGTVSADWNPITAEQKEEAEAQITTNVYWTQFGHKYHLKWSADGDEESCCTYLRGKEPYEGTVTQAIEAGRTSICAYCAAHYAAEMGLELEDLNVEDRDTAEQPGLNIKPGTQNDTQSNTEDE